MVRVMMNYINKNILKGYFIKCNANNRCKFRFTRFLKAQTNLIIPSHLPRNTCAARDFSVGSKSVVSQHVIV